MLLAWSFCEGNLLQICQNMPKLAAPLCFKQPAWAGMMDVGER